MMGAGRPSGFLEREGGRVLVMNSEIKLDRDFRSAAFSGSGRNLKASTTGFSRFPLIFPMNSRGRSWSTRWIWEMVVRV